ncbi:hypothetical protein GCM10018793_31640 [Streptomyces sulfonofaciens]|uniref:Uncharacterized protein n=1 Tax=Streptomyces sulfonofaciens TaxID=68272 RepID=A0A919L0T2_9ACTN|nr:hypothetical protein GCM10018793_31640 [Streptomyces sulfonofaciens]
METLLIARWWERPDGTGAVLPVPEGEFEAADAGGVAAPSSTHTTAANAVVNRFLNGVTDGSWEA